MKQIDTIHEIEDIVVNIQKRQVNGIANGVIPEHIFTSNQITKKQYHSMLHGFATGCNKKDISVLCDTSIMLTGKTGILFTTDGFYYDCINRLRTEDPISQPILYSELQNVLEGDIPGTFILLYKNGSFERCFGGIYTNFLILCLNLILTKVFDVVPSDHLKTETIEIQNTRDLTTEHRPLVISHTDIPEINQVSIFNSTPFVVLQKKKSGTWKRVFYELTIRELNTSVISKIEIGWDTSTQTPTYISEFLSPVSHTGFELVNKDGVIQYKRIMENYLYPILDCKLVLCMYEGANIAKDLIDGNRILIEETNASVRELHHIHKGDIVLACYYQQKKYLVCSYNMEKVSCVNYLGQKEYLDCNSSDLFSLETPTYVYENHAFSEKTPKKGVYYRLLTTKGANVIANNDYPHISNNFTFLKEIDTLEKFVFLKKENEKIHFYDIFTHKEMEFDEGWIQSYGASYAFAKIVLYKKMPSKIVTYTIFDQVEKNSHFTLKTMDKDNVVFKNSTDSIVTLVSKRFFNFDQKNKSSYVLYSCFNNALRNEFKDGMLYFIE